MQKTMRRATLLAALLMPLAPGCGGEGGESTTQEETAPPAQAPVPAFNRDSAYAYVAKQVSFGPRVVNSEAHRACRAWLADKLRGFGAEVIEQQFAAKAYTGETLNGTNIIAQYQPQLRNRIVLAAHWDSRHIADSPLSAERRDDPILGADDGASGVGVLLEIARQLQASPIPVGVDIILFDAEDYGESNREYNTEEEQRKGIATWALGSQHWSRNLHRAAADFRYGILLDMVGSKGARFPKEQYSMYFAPTLVNKVWELAIQLGYGNYFVDEQAGGITDDHYFVNTIARIPMIDIINLPADNEDHSFGHYWHTHQDNMDIIDARTLRAVGQMLLTLLHREAAGAF